ncbi:hypothetical protein HMPREF9080_00489 [Cardiobacterium valvarum F0432]|uniref:Uncharacterized protein n=1 Tax=Cardiobacterium valvarum F0432 TaxID=797473 RepID=G9ZCL2_9GAMM|nr:hypothetical protein HMPREF9080_00489 [Cardiobacterium valvarum F0432]
MAGKAAYTNPFIHEKLPAMTPLSEASNYAACRASYLRRLTAPVLTPPGEVLP